MEEKNEIIYEINEFLDEFEKFSEKAYMYTKFNYYGEINADIEDTIKRAKSDHENKEKELNNSALKLKEMEKMKNIDVDKSYEQFLDITFDLMKKEYTFEEFKNECLEKLK